MDFFARQERSKRTTRYLVLLFSLAFLGVAAASAAVIALVLNVLPDFDTALLSTTLDAQSRGRLLPLLGVAAGTIVLMLAASLYRSALLSRGGGQVARMLGASEVRRDSDERAHRRLVNVVEEMAIASGLPVPEIFVLEQEPGINAFAAGPDHSDAAIAVTQGALERLDRAELQGVIAHEFSHILNGDMRLNQRLMGYSFGILVLSLAGRWLLRSARYARHARRRGMSGGLVLGIALTIIGAIGIFFSRLIKAAVSRQREVLADASAVQFTRDPSGLAAALRKIGGYTANLSSVDSEEVAHMLFGQGSKAFRGWFATHPPLEERIRALDPSFDPSRYAAAAGIEPAPRAAATSDSMSAFAAARDSDEAVLQSTGTVESANTGALLRDSIPEGLLVAAHSRESSFLLTVALVVSGSERIATRQFNLLKSRLGAQRAERCKQLHGDLNTMDSKLRLPLLELAVPALKQRPDEQLRFLFELINAIMELDSERQLFDFVLPRVLEAYLPHRSRDLKALAGPARKLSTLQAIDELLAGTARLGHSDADAALAAYRSGLAAFRTKRPLPARQTFTAGGGSTDFAILDAALDTLLRMKPRLKRETLRAVLATIRHDERITQNEFELFRAIAAALDCPVPPIAVGSV